MTPRAFVVLGPAGSGKSTVARRLAAEARAAYLDKDAVAGPLVELLLRERGDEPWERDENAFYQERIMPLEYASVLGVAADNLRNGMDVVIDAPFRAYGTDAGYLAGATSAAHWPETRIVVVHVVVEPEVLRARLAARGNDRDRWKLAHWDEFWAHARASRCAWHGVEHVELSNDGSEPDAAAIARIAARAD